MLWLLANVLLIGVAALGTRATGTDLELFTGSGQDTGPLELLTANLTLALLIPAAALAVLVVHRERPGWLSSVTGRLRWALLWRFTLLATGTTVVGYAGIALVPEVAEVPAESLHSPDPAVLAVLLAVTWLSTPLQAAAEEYTFRGYLTQAVAGLIPRTAVAWWVAGALSSTVFALAHGTQDPGLFASRLFFGIVATWTVARTGGLEAAIALHAVNNVVVLSIAVSTGALSETLTASDLPWRYAAVDMTATAAFGALVVLWARRLRPERVSAVQIRCADTDGQAPGRSAAFFGPHEQIG
jgi:membrane protease YdiL (CAAX protease family)